MKDAKRRIEEGLADIAIALHYPEYPDVFEEELEDLLKRSTFEAMILVPRQVKSLEGSQVITLVPKGAKSSEGWFSVKLTGLVDIIKHASTYLIEEKDVKREVEVVKEVINDFIRAADGIKGSGNLREKIADILYKLYGFEVTETRDAEVIFGQTALAILLASVLYERVRGFHNFESLSSYTREYGPINGVRKALNDLLKVDYRPALTLAIEILEALPPDLSLMVQQLVNRAIRISEMGSLLSRDFAGRIYHEITGDIAVRKGFATFYTEIPAAYLLSNLAIKSLDVAIPNEKAGIPDLKIADFACGSGTLLTACLYNLSRIVRNYCFLNDLSYPSVERELVENGIYGFDALRYAAQITALNLALMVPEPIKRENISSVYLGVTQDGAWLGSLELLNGESLGGILRWVEGGLEKAVKGVSTTGVTGEPPDSFDIIIMNPPFTRATGRTDKFEGREGLFGFMTNKNVREIMRKRYDDIRRMVRDELRRVAEEFIKSNGSLIGNLKQYLSIGQAGEGLLFLYLAYKYVKPGGVIAFVLPRNFLAGVSWFLARTLLMSEFHVKYIVVSSDPDGYNFSESTSLSECLIVAKRRKEKNLSEETTFVNLLKKPKSALEAIVLSERMEEGLVELESGAKCIIQKVDREALLKNLDNWNKLISLPEPEIVKIGLKVLEGELILNLRVPMARLQDIILSIGIDRHQFNDNFKRVDTETPYPILYGGEEEVRRKMLVSPNAYAIPKIERKRGDSSELYRRFAARVLLPNRIWLDTAHVIALFSEEKLLSNLFYSVKLFGEESPMLEKALVLWLNTTWGLLSVIMNREETRGRWISLTMTQWRNLPVLDVTKLDEDTLKRLSKTFDSLRDKVLRRIIYQFPSDPVRYEIDLNFIKAISPGIDEKKVREELDEIYKRMRIAFKRWIKL
ncbi:MAG: hypothetical protein QW711_05380 [Candidatus Korarchaeum sp.]